MSKFIFVTIAIWAVSLSNVQAEGKDSKKGLEELLTITTWIDECGKELGISREDLKEALTSKNGENIDKCFPACFLKKFGALNDEGKFDLTKGVQQINHYIQDKNLAEKITALFEKCAADANGESVNDGNKGCERAIAFEKCFKLKE